MGIVGVMRPSFQKVLGAPHQVCVETEMEVTVNGKVDGLSPGDQVVVLKLDELQAMMVEFATSHVHDVVNQGN